MFSLDPAVQGNQTLSLFLYVLLFLFKSLRGLQFYCPILYFTVSHSAVTTSKSLWNQIPNKKQNKKTLRKSNSWCHLLPLTLKGNSWWLFTKPVGDKSFRGFPTVVGNSAQAWLAGIHPFLNGIAFDLFCLTLTFTFIPLISLLINSQPTWMCKYFLASLFFLLF